MDEADLHGLTLLAGATDADRRRFADAAAVRTFPAGRAVLRQGELSDAFYVILEGAVRVEQDGEQIARLGPGEFFGEMGALDPGPGYGFARNATVTAVEDLRVAVLPGDRFTELVAGVEPVREHVYAVMRRRDEA